MVETYAVKRQQIEALQFTGKNLKEVREFIGDNNNAAVKRGLILLNHHELLDCHEGDYIVKDALGDVYPLNSAAFNEIYEPVQQHCNCIRIMRLL